MANHNIPDLQRQALAEAVLGTVDWRDGITGYKPGYSTLGRTTHEAASGIWRSYV